MSGDSLLQRLRGLPPGAKTVAFPKSGARLHAMVTSAGYDRCTDPGYDWNGLRRGDDHYVLLQHTIAGRGHLRFGREQRVLMPGQTMLLQFPHDHRYWLARGDAWEFFWLCLNGREVLRIWHEAIAVGGPVVRLDETVVERMSGLCLTVMQGDANSPPRASAIAYTTAMEVAEALLSWGGVRAEAARPDGVRRAVSLAQAATTARAVERVDVAALATASGYSRHHFSRLFAASERETPARYLLRLRMQEAMAALRTSPSPIKVIAQRCGFSDANYFAKVFRRMNGMSPREFRSGGPKIRTAP